MNFFCRCVTLFLLIAGLMLSGCLGGNDSNSGYSAPLTGEILVSAFADAGSGKTFASLRDDTKAEIRAQATGKFQARIKIDDGSPVLYDLTRSTDGVKLNLDNIVVSSLSPGQRRVTVEIVARGAANGSPAIMKRIGHATVVAGQTNDSDIKNVEINYDSTAKALVYEAWAGNANKTIDEMSVDLKSLKTAIQGLIIVGGIINETAALDLQQLAAEIDSAVSKVKTIEVTQTRFAGDYRAFFVNALSAERWVGVSDISVTNGQVSEKIRVNSNISLINTESNYSVIESSGELTFSTVTKNRGAVSASGNVAMVHVWNKTPHIGLFIKQATSATNATIKGTYRVFEFSDAVDASFKPSQPGVQAYSLQFDGEGNFTVKSAFNPDSLSSAFTAGTYRVAGGGRVTFNDLSPKNEYTQVAPDGNMFAHISYTAGNRCVFAVGVKQSSDSTWSGNFVEAAISSSLNANSYASYSSGALVSATGGSYAQDSVRTEKATADEPQKFNYTIEKGGITISGADNKSYSAGLDSSGEAYCIVSKSADNRYNFSLGVKK